VGRIGGKAGGSVAGMGPAPPTISLVEQHNAVLIWIENPSEVRRRSRARATVDEEGGLARSVTASLPVDEVSLTNV